jgi:hypothetical protein
MTHCLMAIRTSAAMAIRTSAAMIRAMLTHTAKIVGGPGAKRKSAKLTPRRRRCGVCLCLCVCVCVSVSCLCLFVLQVPVLVGLFYSSNGPHLYLFI